MLDFTIVPEKYWTLLFICMRMVSTDSIFYLKLINCEFQIRLI